MTYRTPLSESDKFWNYISIANDIFPWGMRMTMNDDADNTDYDDYQGFWAKLFVSTDNTDDAAGAVLMMMMISKRSEMMLMLLNYQAFRAKLFLSTDNMDDDDDDVDADAADDDEDYQALRAKGFLSTYDGSGEEVVSDEAGNGERGDIHETVVG